MEMGGGGGWLLNSSAFFGADTSQMAISSNYNLGLLASFLDGKSPIDVHAGIVGKMTNGVIGNTIYTTLTPWAELRLQISRVYIGVGIAPFVYKRTSPDFGFDNLVPGGTAGQIGFIAEAGFLIPVTPNFTVTIEAASQYIANGFGFSPQPGLDLSANFRFYLWYPGTGGGDSASGTMNSSGSTKSKGPSNEYKGWRYPF